MDGHLDEVTNAKGYRFRLVGSGWHDCAANSYTFQNPPQTADYEVYAVGDGTSFTDSDVAMISYTAPEPKPASEPDPLTVPDTEGTENP